MSLCCKNLGWIFEKKKNKKKTYIYIYIYLKQLLPTAVEFTTSAAVSFEIWKLRFIGELEQWKEK